MTLLHRQGFVFWVLLAAFGVIGVRGQAPRVDTSAIGPRVGQKAPEFMGTDQQGNRQTLASSLATKGAMLVFFRSADW
jgi:hypothetical protein